MTEFAVQARAYLLCKAAEPHSQHCAIVPCDWHRNEARRQLEADVARERQT